MHIWPGDISTFPSPHTYTYTARKLVCVPYKINGMAIYIVQYVTNRADHYTLNS